MALCEQQQIEQIRREELLNQTVKKSDQSYLQLKLIEKDKKIKQLTEIVQMFETGKIQSSKGKLHEVLTINSTNDDFDQKLKQKYGKDIYKMSKADFIMS